MPSSWANGKVSLFKFKITTSGPTSGQKAPTSEIIRFSNRNSQKLRSVRLKSLSVSSSKTAMANHCMFDTGSEYISIILALIVLLFVPRKELDGVYHVQTACAKPIVLASKS